MRIEVACSVALQGEIWTRAVAATREAPSPAGILLLPALNAMIDIATTRIAMTRMHPPIEMFLTMGVLALACALLAGYAMGASPTRSWLHTLGFAAIVALTVYVTVDLEFPRLGVIRVEAFGRAGRSAPASPAARGAVDGPGRTVLDRLARWHDAPDAYAPSDRMRVRGE